MGCCLGAFAIGSHRVLEILYEILVKSVFAIGWICRVEIARFVVGKEPGRCGARVRFCPEVETPERGVFNADIVAIHEEFGSGPVAFVRRATLPGIAQPERGQ